MLFSLDRQNVVKELASLRAALASWSPDSRSWAAGAQLALKRLEALMPEDPELVDDNVEVVCELAAVVPKWQAWVTVRKSSAAEWLPGVCHKVGELLQKLDDQVAADG